MCSCHFLTPLEHLVWHHWCQCSCPNQPQISPQDEPANSFFKIHFWNHDWLKQHMKQGSTVNMSKEHTMVRPWYVEHARVLGSSRAKWLVALTGKIHAKTESSPQRQIMAKDLIPMCIISKTVHSRTFMAYMLHIGNYYMCNHHHIL